jgi:Flp pilus assembly protein protease CpaA
MIAVALWWGYDRSLAIKLGSCFVVGDTTMDWLSNDGSCFVVGIRQQFGYRMMAVALWWGYESSLALELWQLFCGGDTTVVCLQSFDSQTIVVSPPQSNCHNSIANYRRIPTTKQLP